jgi:hypothetical protein
MMEEGIYKCEKALDLYRVCNETGEWPNREPVIRQLEYPGWYKHAKVEESFEDVF